ncbi:hypothetical protein DV096_02705 [Bradymonadaceae bacterium TMQ3]|nr:hypothetical protein DV096_02705 [Bradymonadaceae bacterium TMQ3]TXC77757.1 hypothetical protein FRC91_03210 [Bradymonadales bacterium TMQ1]
MKPAVLMAHPRHFTIKGGANPHTRNKDKSLKEVDPTLALEQWNTYVDQLVECGLDVYVIDPTPELTGMVFTANAGFIYGLHDTRPSPQKTFFPSHFMVEHRMGETERFADFFTNFGLQVSDIPEQWRWEGEADAFPVLKGADQTWIFTHGFRSDSEVGDWLESGLLNEDVVSLTLSDERYYHGDTAICDLGDHVLVYLDALEPVSRERIKEVLGERLVEIEEKDARAFLGNSFYVEVEERRLLFVPAGVRKKTQKAIEKLGVEVIEIDVSEFFGKGGGGPKCMIFNLGVCDPAEAGLTEEQSAFRHARHINSLRRRRGRIR